MDTKTKFTKLLDVLEKIEEHFRGSPEMDIQQYVKIKNEVFSECEVKHGRVRTI